MLKPFEVYINTVYNVFLSVIEVMLFIVMTLHENILLKNNVPLHGNSNCVP